MALNLDNLVSQVRIETAWGPPIVIDRPFAPDAGGGPSPLAWLKPKITIIPASSAFKPVVSAPWGEPGPTRWPLVQAAAIGAGVVLVGLLGYSLIRLSGR